MTGRFSPAASLLRAISFHWIVTQLCKLINSNIYLKINI